jgi:hypothetical protein
MNELKTRAWRIQVLIKMNNPNKFDEVRTKIAAVAATASDTDKREVEAIITQAKTGDYQSEKSALTPGMAALLFIEHNPYNRDWKGSWSLELLRRMDEGQWEANGDTIRFYRDGAIADGQNRLAAIALFGKVVEVIIVYGLNRKAILTVDGGKSRYASDEAKLSGIDNAVAKEKIVKMTASYLIKTGDKKAEVRSEVEVSREITANNRDLETAINLGLESSDKVAKPTLKPIPAATVAYLLIKGKWPLATIKEKLLLFQSGVSQEGGDDPFFVAAKLIEKSQASTIKRDKLSTTKELGVAIYALVQRQKGVRAVSSAKFRDAVKTQVPTVDYPVETEQQTA